MAHTPKPIRKKNKAAKNRSSMIFLGSGTGKTMVMDGAVLADLIKSAKSRTPVYLDPLEIHEIKSSEETRRALDARIRRGRLISKGVESDGNNNRTRESE